MSSRKNKNSGNRSGIITDDNAIIDPGEIEENFNFFISIGTNLQKKPPTKKTFTNYLLKPNSESFIVAPTTADKISDLIQNLESSKNVLICPLKS